MSAWPFKIPLYRLSCARLTIDLRQSGGLGLLPPPFTGEGWGEGRQARILMHALSLSLPRKRGRGRCGAALRNARRQQPTSILTSIRSPAAVAQLGAAHDLVEQ